MNRERGYEAHCLDHLHPALRHGAHDEGGDGHPEDGHQERHQVQSLRLRAYASPPVPTPTVLAGGDHMAEEPADRRADVLRVERRERARHAYASPPPTTPTLRTASHLGGGGDGRVGVDRVEALLVGQVLVQVRHRADGLYDRARGEVLP